jgi:hypothetical protein
MRWEEKNKDKNSIRLLILKISKFNEIIYDFKEQFDIPEIGFHGECRDNTINFIFHIYAQHIIFTNNDKIESINDRSSNSMFNNNVILPLFNNDKYLNISKSLFIITTVEGEVNNKDSCWF